MEFNIIAVFILLSFSHLTTVQCFIDCKGLDFDENHEVKMFTLDQFLKSDGKSSKIVSSGTNLQHLTTGMIDRKQWYQYYVRKVDLSENNVTVIDAEPFQTIKTCLVVIDLSKNQITTIKRNGFSNLPVLQKLDLSTNKLTIVSGDWFDSTNVLKNLILTNNNIKQITTNIVFKSMNILQLGNNNLLPIAGMFKSFPALLILNLENNNITTLPIGVFEGLTLIEQLLLGHNKINEFKLGTLSGLKTLETLNISHNSLNQEQLAKIVHFPLPYLESLIIDGNEGKYLNINELMQYMPKIKHIGLGNMSWDCKDLIEVYKQCQKYKIDILTHVTFDYTLTNVHGIACTQNNATNSSKTVTVSSVSSSSNDYSAVQTSSTIADNDVVSITESSSQDPEYNDSDEIYDKENLQQEKYRNTDDKLLSDVKIIGVVLIFLVIILIVVIVFKGKLIKMQRTVRHYVQEKVYRNDKIETTSDCDMSLVDNHLHLSS